MQTDIHRSISIDLSGCVSIGMTHGEVEQNMREAIEFHLGDLQLQGLPLPKASISSAHAEVAA